MTGPNPFLQGTQATTKPNVPKKKFKGTRKVLNHSGVVEEMLNPKDSADLVAQDKRVRAKMQSGDRGGNIDLSSRGPGNRPKSPAQPTTTKDSPDDVSGDERQAKSPKRDAFIGSGKPINSPNETDDDNDGKAIHALIGDTQAGDSKGARDRYIDYMISQAGKTPPAKKKFAGKPKEKK